MIVGLCGIMGPQVFCKVRSLDDESFGKLY